MVELGRGVKAGILAGLVYGIFSAFTIPLFFYLFASLFGFNTSPSLFGGYYVQLGFNPFALIIAGPILGLILGIIYALTYNRLPGREIGKTWGNRARTRPLFKMSETKSIVLTFVVWIIIVLVSIPTQLQTSLFFSEVESALNLQIIMTAWAFFLFVPFLGQLLGQFWDRFKPKTPQPEARTEHISYPANQALTLPVFPSLSSRKCILLSFVDVVRIVGFFTSAEVAERIGEAV